MRLTTASHEGVYALVRRTWVQFRLLLRSTIQYAFIRRFLLKKVRPTRFYGVGWMNCHLTLD